MGKLNTKLSQAMVGGKSKMLRAIIDWKGK